MGSLGFLFIIGFTGLLMVSPFIFISLMKRKKELNRIEGLSPEQRQLEMVKLQASLSKYNTSHVLHFFLSFLFLGLWVIPWFLIAQSNASQKRRIERLMGDVVNKAS